MLIKFYKEGLSHYEGMAVRFANRGCSEPDLGLMEGEMHRGAVLSDPALMANLLTGPANKTHRE